MPGSKKNSPATYKMFWSDDIPEIDQKTGSLLRIVAGRQGDVVGVKPPKDR
jgi:redox-sensitive bicupin YhaK (pirin superfamily)